ncbi:MAG TPA: hypothetical protein VGQ46_00050 [Thermoanaerobaculia bacterium]|nr:hypothetical protein [Thermoanaerobaculia bacterium]
MSRSISLLLLGALTSVAAAAPPLRVGRIVIPIVIQAVPVYSGAETARGRLYSFLNVLHVQTRAELLRQFLVFHEGDAFDAALLAETERNLRLFDFLESVSLVSTLAPGGRNTIASFDGSTVARFDTRFPQAFVARVHLDAGWQLDRDAQFLADRQSGLRAYRTQAC